MAKIIKIKRYVALNRAAVISPWIPQGGLESERVPMSSKIQKL